MINKNSFLELLCTVIILVILNIMVYQYLECKNCGGDFVRGFFWFQCLK